jgi:N-acetylmuramoyl-L-alanine amidase
MSLRRSLEMLILGTAAAVGLSSSSAEEWQHEEIPFFIYERKESSIDSDKSLPSKLEESVQKKVVVFAGHITKSLSKMKNGRGAISASGIKEYEFNNRIVEQLCIRGSGFYCEPVLSGKNIIFQERPEVASKLGADIYLEVHHDSARSRDLDSLRKGPQTPDRWKNLSGFSVWFCSRNACAKESERLALTIAERLANDGFKPNHYHATIGKKMISKNGVYDADLYVLRETRIPAVIVEAGVITNPFEERVLKEKGTQERLANAIAGGLATYFTQEKEYQQNGYQQK